MKVFINLGDEFFRKEIPVSPFWLGSRFLFNINTERFFFSNWVYLCLKLLILLDFDWGNDFCRLFGEKDFSFGTSVFPRLNLLGINSVFAFYLSLSTIYVEFIIELVFLFFFNYFVSNWYICNFIIFFYFFSNYKKNNNINKNWK